MQKTNGSPAARPTFLEDARINSDPARSESDYDGASPGAHITVEAPPRPALSRRTTVRGESVKSISEALRLARSREEQETLLGEHEQAVGTNL